MHLLSIYVNYILFEQLVNKDNHTTHARVCCCRNVYIEVGRIANDHNTFSTALNTT